MSFQSSFGSIFQIIIILTLTIGIFIGIPLLILIAGYISIITGLVLFFATFSPDAYIGKILWPVMLSCFFMQIIIGAALVFNPFQLLILNATGWESSNINVYALYGEIIIMILALIHMITKK